MDRPDQQLGVDLIKQALRAPCSTIAKNAGKDTSIVVEKILSANSASIGYDALKDQYVDMIQEGGYARSNRKGSHFQLNSCHV